MHANHRAASRRTLLTHLPLSTLSRSLRLVAGASALFLAVGCSGRTDDASPSADEALASTTHLAGDTFVGSAGNRIGVDFTTGADRAHGKPSIGQCAAHETELDVFYNDDDAFFGNAASIKLWSRTRDTTGKSSTSTDSMNASSGAYVFTRCIGAGPSPVAIDLAFADAAERRWDSDNSRNYHVDLTHSGGGNSDPKAERDTAVGNHVSVEIVLDPPSNGNCATPMLMLTYDDKTNLFGHAPSIQLFYKVNNTQSDEDVHGFAGLTQSQPGHYETVRQCIGWSSQSRSLELAFTDDHKAKWDSNNSQNYVFKF